MTPLHLQFTDPLMVFLKKRRHNSPIFCALNRKTTIKDIIESYGVPHTEVGQIMADGVAMNFDWYPENNHTIKISHIVPPFDVYRPSLLRQTPIGAIKFIVDVNVGRLAQLLRLIGMDTAYIPEALDAEIADKAARERRIVLTKDVGLLKRKCIVFGKFVRAIHPEEQLKEVVDFFGLQGPFSPFSRCLLCNGPIADVAKETVIHRLEPKTILYYHTFRRCQVCGQIYWRGSHYDRLASLLMDISRDFVHNLPSPPVDDDGGA